MQAENQVQSHQSFQKIIIIGDASVGKTNMIYVFDKGRKPLSANPTVGVQFTSKTVTLPDSRKVRAQIWDTAGQQQFRAVTMSHYRQAAGAIIVFDITNRSSFQHVRQWYAAVVQRADPAVQIALVGHKSDTTRRAVGKTQGQQFAKAHKIFYAQTNYNDLQSIKNVFVQLLQRIVDTNAKKLKNNNIRLGNQSNESQSGCRC